jgi:cytochrome c2
MRKLTIVLTSFILFAFCALSIESKHGVGNSNLIESSDSDDTLFGLDFIPTDIAAGESIFKTSCQNCHSTAVSHYKNQQGWDSITRRMGQFNAGLDSSQIIDLNSYIIWQLERTDSSNVIPVIGSMRQW